MSLTPAAIVDHLLTAADWRSAAAALRSTIDLAVLDEVKHRVDATKLRNAQHALAIAEIGLELAEYSADPLVTGLAYWAYGNALFHRSRFQEAYKAYQQAETYYDSSQYPLERTRLQINQIAALQDLGAFEAALTIATNARTACAQIGPAAEPFLALLEMNSGAVYHQLGRSAEALAAYERGRAILVQRANLVETARIDINRANVLQEMGRFDEAVTLYSAARSVLAGAGMAQEVARAEHNLGKLAYRRGHYQAALRHLEAARNGYAGIPNPLEVAKADLYRALVYRDLNLLSETVELANAAERAFVRADTRWERAMALLVAGSGQARLQQVAVAERLLARARRLLRAQGATERLPALDLERAELLLAAGQVNSARRLASRVHRQTDAATWPAQAVRAQLLLAAADLAQTPPHAAAALRRATLARNLAEQHDLPELATAIYTLGQAQEAAGAPGQAHTAYQEAIAALAALRVRLPVDTLHLAFLNDKLPLYHAAARLSLEQHDLSAGFAAISQALSAPIPQPDATPPPIAAELRTLRERWHWQQTRMEDLAERGVARSAAAQRATAARLADLERAIADLLLRREATTDTDVPAASPAAAATLERLQGTLAPGEGVLVGIPLGAQVALMLVTPATVHHQLGPAPNLERMLRAWRFQIQHVHAAGVAPPALSVYLQRFHAALIAPFTAELHQLARLYVAFDPAWHDLPLAAAFDGAHHLIERVELRYISSPAALLDGPQRHPTPQAPALVVGHSDGGRLPATLAEAEAVAALHAHSGPVTCLLEADARPADILAALPGAGLVHIAAHAVFRPDNPRFSWVRLHDGRLAVADLADLRLTGRPLVILSACETGRGIPRGGGLLGMGRTLLLAGASALIVSLWPIVDAGAATLMPAVHQAIHATPNPATALAVAQRRAIHDQLDPFDWAGFICIER
jgi:CHAT domain-containing protein/tetratricopeptide (TPR) repeat protein